MISVVIPTLNEAARLPRLLGRLAAEPTPHEVVVVDGGSDDATVFAAHAAEARVLYAGPGRGQQLAAGADAASGDTLLFLHADSRFPAGGLARIEATLARHPNCPGGNFRLIFDGDTPFSRWLTGFYAWIRAHGLYYGDSGVFVRRRVYDEVGGFTSAGHLVGGDDSCFTRLVAANTRWKMVYNRDPQAAVSTEPPPRRWSR